jgi:hypothetical protein
LIICHLAGLILLQSDFLARILFPRKSLIGHQMRVFSSLSRN